jgi:hypothetical protein
MGAGPAGALAKILVVRNVAVATAIAVNVLGRVEFAVFAAVYFWGQGQADRPAGSGTMSPNLQGYCPPTSS